MPSETSESLLKSRSYIGLLLAQFLAAFNDQAIHFVAIFYAGDMLVRYVGTKHIDEKAIVTIVTACFISPFFFFSPLAGVLADKFSKRTIIVFWKYAEIAITGLALMGFLLPHAAGWGWASQQTLAVLGAALVVAAVFMMGTHSAFFIPAKYGIMPEILSTSVLSRGNGLLEGTSFTANILGTAFGGFCYGRWKSGFTTTGDLIPGAEWRIGVILLGLAVVGTFAARLISRVPAAAPDQPLVWQPWIPLKSSLAVLRTSRPLVLATVGIAFFTFMTLFVRQTLIFQGESAKARIDFERFTGERKLREHTPDDLDIADPTLVMPAANPSQQSELRVAMLVAIVGLGVGIGCAAAGQLSGDRIELGLVPLGAVLMVFLTALLAWVISTHRIHSDWPLNICLVFVGVAAGLYIVPLYTLLQHRAPKESKGSLVAMSNFLNVSGGLVAIVVFFVLTGAMQSLMGLTLREQVVKPNPELWEPFHEQLTLQLQIPRMLFFACSLITLIMLLLLFIARPDFLLRTLSWFRVPGRRRLHAVGLSNVPADGHIILATNCHGTDQWLQVLSAIDRGTRFVKAQEPRETNDDDDPFLDSVARGLRVLIPAPNSTSGRDWERTVESGARSLEAGNLVGLALDCPATKGESDLLLQELQARVPSEVLPVYCGAGPIGHSSLHRAAWRPIVAVGKPLPFGATPDQIRAAIRALGDGAHDHGATKLDTMVH
jgi:MFS family permease